MFEITNHGGIIAIIRDDEKTNELKYTQDEGLSWNVVNFYDQKIDV